MLKFILYKMSFFDILSLYSTIEDVDTCKFLTVSIPVN